MVPNSSTPDRTLAVAILAGVLYAGAVLGWALLTGFQFAANTVTALVFGFGYAAFGMFLVAAIPLYLLARLSLVSPTFIAMWSFGNTVYLRWYVPRPHDALASYLAVWPLFVGLIVLVAIGEVSIRLAVDRIFGRLGFRVLY